MMQEQDPPVFSPEIPPDLDHATQVREEALDWLETHFTGAITFTTGEVLRMAVQGFFTDLGFVPVEHP